MATEKELKLAFGGADAAENEAATVERIQRFFAARTVRPAKTFLLGNVYFDTSNLDLAREKVALRLRRTPDGWLQTLKTAGQAKDGLHARGEWEMPVENDTLDLPALLAMCDDVDAVKSLSQHAPTLANVFRTDFERTTWDVTIDGSEIEAALDLGKVHLGGDTHTAHVPIREIELELKTGDESALWQIARALQDAIPGLTPDDVSKAARGYRLVRDVAAQSQTTRAHANAEHNGERGAEPNSEPNAQANKADKGNAI